MLCVLGCMQIKVALPRRLCGVVIGQQGSTVRNFMTDSGATIRVQSLNDLSREDSERIVTIYGSRDKVLRAAALVLNAVRTRLLCAADAVHHV